MTQTLPPRVRKSRMYLPLLLLLPAGVLLWMGIAASNDVVEGGTVESVKLTTKTGFVGQASEAVANVSPESPDLYLKLFLDKEEQIKLHPFKDTPIGNGLTWNLDRKLDLHAIKRVEVWDYNKVFSDKEQDRITMEGWDSEGQKYHMQLIGRKNEAPTWAFPLTIAGGVLGGLVLLKFVWDQAL